MAWMITAAAVLAALAVYAACCTAANADGKRRGGQVRRFLAWVLAAMFAFAVLAGIVAIMGSDRLDLIRATKNAPLPAGVKEWFWGWR